LNQLKVGWKVGLRLSREEGLGGLVWEEIGVIRVFWGGGKREGRHGRERKSEGLKMYEFLKGRTLSEV
jgi:hypothetical protein